MALPANAVIAKRGIMTYTQPDGTRLSLSKEGDERFHMKFTPDGFPVMTDDRGFYVYASVDDKRFMPSAVRARDIEARTPSDREFLARISPAMIQAAYERESDMARSRRAAAATRGPGICSTDFPSTGKQKAIVILVEFTDVKFNDKNAAKYKFDDAYTYFHELLNKPGFDTNGASGSARDWFIDNSNGLFEPEFDIYGPVSLSENYRYYGTNDWYGDDLHAHDMVIEACRAIDDDVDFTEYDRDNDGVIDNVYVFYAGLGEADYADDDLIWPHSWTMTEAGCPGITFDGVVLDHYACSNETDGEYFHPDGIGTFAHEFSHVMGLPDLYCTASAGRPFTPGEYSVLDYGPYNNHGFTPPNYSAYERYALNWLTPEQFGSHGEYSLENIGESNFAYLIPTEKENEYFLLENRQQSGWDEYIPGHGMIVWHVDYNKSVFDANTVNNMFYHQYVDMVEADDKRNENTRDGDPFPGASKVTDLDYFTTPSLISWGKKDTEISISDIRETGGKITMNVANFGFTGISVAEISPDSGIQIVGSQVVSDAPLDIFDLSGRRITTLSETPVTLSPGIYIIEGNKKICIK